ncbi:hypothetical protein [Streptomyces jumonjinensis]|uniref:Uncharacterized protein n=1 Tax=Streptomyces jumonjinensis TaxID=1945 RepID=A0A646KSV1_STRJU|nr:hypothetical protein [Streptomyces jumonjinensis]MQT05399.1 hypothetical protein [Streptomyces jumonjinensis]
MSTLGGAGADVQRADGARVVRNVMEGATIHGPVVQAGHIENLNIVATDALSGKRQDAYEAFASGWAVLEQGVRKCAVALWTVVDPYEFAQLWISAHEAWCDLRDAETRIALFDGDETPAARVVASAQRALMHLDPIVYLDLFEGVEEAVLPCLREENQLCQGRQAVDEGHKEFRAFLRHAAQMTGERRPEEEGR